ncbi:MAG TPA: FkbM family methyltransferase, partial [Bryobacteraceae bacterium]|nr:FkbM family methyltransferase [Bryobacteraceae bacterium]
IDYPERTFDVVWSCSSVEHVSTLPELVQIFREIHRVLKPGGHALITTEFSLDEPYFLPGVLSLWKDCALLTQALQGLSLVGPVDLDYRGSVAGNQAMRRRDVHRAVMADDIASGPTGVCIHVGYTRLIPVAFALQKTGESFVWPEHLGAPAWYLPFSAGVEAFGRKEPRLAAESFRKALDLADGPGARLHCFRQLIEAHVHAGDVLRLREALLECAKAVPALPGDDDALDLIAYVAAGQGMLPLAQLCWERAERSPSALPISRLRIRSNQLAAELNANGRTAEAAHINALADAAWCEALDFNGGDPQMAHFASQLSSLRQDHGLTSLVSSKSAAPAERTPITPRSPHFDLAAAPSRPMVYVGNNLALTRTVYGQKMYVDTASQVGACFLMDGYWEEWVVRRLKDYVKPGMRVLDLGANMGFYTLLLCDLVGPQGHVTAFEPWPHYHEILRRNVEVNGYSGRCTLVRKAVHEAGGSKDLVFFEGYGTGALKGGEAFFEQPGMVDTPTVLSVETVSLDEYLAANPQQIDFIKMDVDGSEPFVLRGAQSLLRGTNPLTIFCEFCPPILRAAGLDPEAFLEELRRARFAISRIAPDGLKEIRPSEGLKDTDWDELLLVRA